MFQDNVIKLPQPGEFCDALTEVLRQGARTLFAQAVEAEVASFLESHADKLTEDGHLRLVRPGHLPEREIATGIGHVGVRQPRGRDRGAQGAKRIHFSPSILSAYARIFGSERLTHHVHILEMNGGSYRLATSKKALRRSAQGQSQNPKTPDEGDPATEI